MRSAAAFFLLSVLLLALPSHGAEPSEGLQVTFHARWSEAETRRPIETTFPGEFILTTAARTPVEVRAFLEGYPAKIVSVRPLPGAEGRIRHETVGPLVLRADVGEESGPVWVDLYLNAPCGSARRRVCLFVPHVAQLSRGEHGVMTVLGQRLGTYYDPRASGVEKVNGNPASYAPPRHFVQITDETGPLWVSPSLRLQDLVVPTEETGQRHTRFVPVNYPLLGAIERLRDRLRQEKIPGELRFLSLFRAPDYNRGIGSGRYGRHVYGDALDFVIDVDGDGRMDDLTGDKRVDREDGLRLVHLIEDLQASGVIPMGGIGLYTFAGGDHPVTMHLDLRGHRATWAFHHRGGRKGAFEWTSRRFAEQDEAEKREREAKAKKK